MKPCRVVLSGLLLLASTSFAIAQEVKVGGQLRPRAEYRDPFSGGAGDSDAFVSTRTRANVTASLEKNVTVFLQVQDVRIWGEETNTLTDFNAENFDLHQGYIDVRSDNGLLLGRVGRQEVNLGGQRLVGAVGWTQQGRSFDGLLLSGAGGFGVVNVFLAQLGNDITPDVDRDAQLVAGYGTIEVADDQAVDLYAIFNRVDNPEGGANTDTEQTTFGARWIGAADNFIYRAEGSFQTGDRGGTDVSAYMFGGRLGYLFADGKATLTLWYDYLSGDDDADDGKTKVFDTLFATNHKFYGYADLFLNIPVHTAGQGLQDLALKLAVRPLDDWRFSLDAHSFRLAKTEGFDSGHLGEEIDFVATWTYSPNLSIQGGAAFLLQDDTWAAIGRLSKDMTWLYLMMDARF
jgi:hypothetical protein